MHTSILTLALGAAVVALAAAPASSVSAQTQKVSATVKFGDLNLSSKEGASAAYQRIKSTARHLCGPEPDIGELGGMDAWRSCVSDAVNDAVGRLNAPMVTAFNGGRTTTYVQLAEAR